MTLHAQHQAHEATKAAFSRPLYDHQRTRWMPRGLLSKSIIHGLVPSSISVGTGSHGHKPTHLCWIIHTASLGTAQTPAGDATSQTVYTGVTLLFMYRGPQTRGNTTYVFGCQIPALSHLLSYEGYPTNKTFHADSTNLAKQTSHRLTHLVPRSDVCTSLQERHHDLLVSILSRCKQGSIAILQ